MCEYGGDELVCFIDWVDDDWCSYGEYFVVFSWYGGC